MADIDHTPTRRERILMALTTACMKLRPNCRRTFTTANPCADLWDDQLELIELLMEIDANLAILGEPRRELDWEKAPNRSASVNDFIEWIVRELDHG